jgi:hypothetical protein
MKRIRSFLIGVLSVGIVVLVVPAFGDEQQAEQLKALKAENAKLREENTVLRKLAGSSASHQPSREGDRAPDKAVDAYRAKEVSQTPDRPKETDRTPDRPREGDHGMLTGIIEKIDGGKVTIKSHHATTVVMPYWRGGMPQDGGGFDKGMLERIGTLKVGEGVVVKWTFQEHYRIDSIAVAEQDRPAKKTE